MLGKSILTESAMRTQLGAESILNPKDTKWKRSLAADLLLTALIDAFSILVIFLLMNFSSTGDILFIGKDMELPKAAKVDVLERNPIVKVEQGKYFIEDKETTADGLVAQLLELRKQWQEAHAKDEFKGIVTIQADRRTKYESLNSIVLAMAHAGYSDIRFAVLAK